MSGPKIAYQHFCPAARALEVVGEKWSLLIVRDLLAGPRRFSDLRRSLQAITPRWLSLRLQELEEAGVLTREARGQREVWYQLTPKGESLAPVLDTLMVWGIENALRPPYPDEGLRPGAVTQSFVKYLNRRAVRLPQPVTWLVRLDGAGSITIRYDGDRWTSERAESAADLVVQFSSADWARYLTSGPEQRRAQIGDALVAGAPEHVEEFVRTLGKPDRAPAEPVGAAS